MSEYVTIKNGQTLPATVKEKAEFIRAVILSVPPQDRDELKDLIQRGLCSSCWGENPNCQCWNDE